MLGEALVLSAGGGFFTSKMPATSAFIASSRGYSWTRYTYNYLLLDYINSNNNNCDNNNNNSRSNNNIIIINIVITITITSIIIRVKTIIRKLDMPDKSNCNAL
jgi:hypothetical protein